MRSSIIGALVLASLTGTAFADSQKPTIPENVNATAISSDAVRVTWSKSVDNQGINGYNIYRNQRYYATVRGTTSFIDEQVSAGSTYEYSVVAFDDARNYTVLSEGDQATPGGGASSTGAAPRAGASVSSGNGRPSAPGSVNASAQGDGAVKVSWNSDSKTTNYNIYRDSSYKTTVRGTSSWTDANVDGGRDYRYQVVAISDDSRYSLPSAPAVASTSGGSSDSSSSSPEPVAAEAPAAAQPQASSSSSSAVPDGYRLVFSEDFNGRDLDSSKWNSSYRWGANWTINDEQQYYVDKLSNPDFGVSPFEFDGNRMSIVANNSPDRNSTNGKSYTSGVLTTYKKFEMKYGYVEMRAKLPKGQGLWPAFWLLNVSDYGSTPEIDVMEFLGNEPDTIYNVYHSKYVKTPSYEAKGPDYTSDFHTFGMKWTEGKIIWYVDGKEVNRYESGYVANEAMYLIVNLALGGSWGGNVDGSTPFPARYQIDYIRAYQR